jgi:hypothetical protein
MMLSRRASVLLWLGIDGFGDSSTPYTCGWPYVTNLFWTSVMSKIDLFVDAPKWVSIHPGSRRNMVNDYGPYNFDGLPPSRHAYSTGHFLKSLNKIILPTRWGIVSGGQVDAYNVLDNTWDHAGHFATPGGRATWVPKPTWPDWPQGSPNYGIAVVVDTRDDSVIVARDRIWVLDTKKREWSGPFGFFNPDGSAQRDCGPFYLSRPNLFDARRGNRWVHGGILNGIDGIHKALYIALIDLTAPRHAIYTAANVTGDMVADGFANFDEDSWLVHDLDNDRYCYIGHLSAMDRLYAIDPVTWVSKRILDIPHQNYPGQGTYNKVAYFEELGGIAYQPAYQYNMYFIPTER